MGKESKNIEDFFRNEFSGYTIIPSEGVWTKLAKKLSLREFFKFSFSSFNVFYLVVLISTVIGVVVLIENSRESELNIPFEDAINNDRTNDLTENDKAENRTLNPQKTNSNKQNTDKEEAIPRDHLENSNNSSEIVAEKDHLGIIKSKQENKIIDSPTNKSLSNIIEPVLKPRARYLVNVKSGCVPLSVRFINTSENASDYDWQFGDGGVSTEENPSYIFDKPGEYIVRLTASSKVGKDKFEYEVIQVFEKPEANFEIYPSNVLIPGDPVNFHNYSRNAVQYEWSFGDGTNSTLYEPTHYYSTTGSYSITLKVWSEKACIDTITILNAFENSVFEIRFPSAFTANPNGPSNGYYTHGLTTNEVFHPVYKGVAEYHLKIYNRFGTLVFESNDINIGWDGYINDHLAKQGVYIWKARGSYINGQTFVKFGNVTLIKK